MSETAQPRAAEAVSRQLLENGMGDIRLFHVIDDSAHELENNPFPYEGIRAPFFRLKMFVEPLGSVATEAFQNYIAFKCVAAPGKRQTVARVKFRIRNGGLRVLIREGLLDNIRLEKDDFTRPYSDGREREITIRDEEHFRRAEPLLSAAYENLLRRTSSSHADSGIYPRSPGVSPR